MSLEEFKKSEIAFFEEALRKWSRLIELYNHVFSPDRISFTMSQHVEQEANKIIAWFQENYMEHTRHSKFRIVEDLPSGKKADVDPILDLVFRGAHFKNICRHRLEFRDDINEGAAFLRGHLGAIKNLTSLPKGTEEDIAPLFRVRKMLSRYNLVVGQLGRRRRNKPSFIIEDEYDVQDLLHALLRLDFDDIRKEEWTPSYAGGSSRMDLLLKKEKIVIEVKKTSENVKGDEIGKQLLVDIAKYKGHPDAKTLVCFIYDSDLLIDNSVGLKYDLEKQSTEELRVEVIVCSR